MFIFESNIVIILNKVIHEGCDSIDAKIGSWEISCKLHTLSELVEEVVVRGVSEPFFWLVNVYRYIV